jgi:hypothetical protein
MWKQTRQCGQQGCVGTFYLMIWSSRFQNISVPYTTHPTTGYLDNRCYRELRSYLRHTEWQVGISLTFFFHFINFLDFKFIRNFIPMVKMFWLSGTADYFETDYHWQQMLAIGNSDMNSYFWFIFLLHNTSSSRCTGR